MPRPVQVYDFTAFSRRTPTAQPPGDRLDAQFRVHADAIAEIQRTLAELDRKLIEQLSRPSQRETLPNGALGPNAGGFYAADTLGATATASDYAQVAIDWAEWMPGTIPGNILAINAITGDHWSSRWWANKAGSYVAQIGTWGFVGSINGQGVFCEGLTVTATNTLSHLTQVPSGPVMLVVSGQAFFSVGAHPAFLVIGQTISWLSDIYTLAPGADVTAWYPYAQAGPPPTSASGGLIVQGPVDLQVQTVVQSGANLAIDRTLGENCALSLTASITAISIVGWPAGGMTGKVRLVIANTGAFAISGWPAGTIWPGGAAPTVTLGAGKKDIVLLMSDDGGVTIYGSVVGQDYR